MVLLPRLHLPQDPLLLSSFAFLLASLSATQAEGASSLEIWKAKFGSCPALYSLQASKPTNYG